MNGFGASVRRRRARIEDDGVRTALWPGERLTEVPGRRLRSGGVVEKDAPLLTVVGVVEDIHAGTVDRVMLRSCTDHICLPGAAPT